MVQSAPTPPTRVMETPLPTPKPGRVVGQRQQRHLLQGIRTGARPRMRFLVLFASSAQHTLHGFYFGQRCMKLPAA